MSKKMHIKSGDTVVVISGKYANGEEKAVGKVIGVSPSEGKVMLYCPTCQAGRRVRHVKNADGERTRICVKCGNAI